jgi:hypothetical protein
MRRIFVAVLVIAVAGALATAASAASVHFKKGGTPTCTITPTGTGSTSTTCTGEVAGLGMENVEIDVTVSGFAVFQCQNKGGNLPPGQNKVLVGPTTTPTMISSGEIKNGNLLFTTAPAPLTAPETVSGEEAGCPNSNFTGVNPTLTVTGITLEFFQGGNLVFTCRASNPSGLSGTVTLSDCTFA